MFSAHVEYDEPGPFSFTDGPVAVGLAEALAWARARAERVVLRVGDRQYSAGADPVPRFPPLPRSVLEAPAVSALPRPDHSTGIWRARASTAWFRRDAEAVARRLADAVVRDGRVTAVEPVVREEGFSVSFTLESASEAEARERAAEVVRGAWGAIGAEAVPGEDFDVPSIAVRSI
jgi:hypothetical protein